MDKLVFKNDLTSQHEKKLKWYFIGSGNKEFTMVGWTSFH